MKAQYLLILMLALAPLGASAFSPLPSAGPVYAAEESLTAPAYFQIDVPPILQSGGTSCGEAVITMAYNHAHPDTGISEGSVIDYAQSQGLFTPSDAPFTSPDAMRTIAEHFAGPVYSGSVESPQEGLYLLEQQLRVGNPVIIDVTTYLNDPSSGAHFVLVTGLMADPQTGKIVVRYNNPLNGHSESANWDGSEGVWNAWQNNGDPGGAGWWLMIESSQAAVTY